MFGARLARPSMGHAWCLAALLLLGGGCAQRSATGAFTPPSNARAWEAKWVPAFDDDYTPEPINLSGRAPHDVRDQKLLALRMGEADIMAQVRVVQVWGRGRYQGRPDQYLEVEVEQYLVGQPVKGTAKEQLVKVASDDPLPGTLQGESLVLFLRWAPGEQPPFHHHLMPMDAEVIAFVAAVIEHAKQQGVLDSDGVPTEKQRSGRKGKSGRSGKKDKKDKKDKKAKAGGKAEAGARG